MPITTTWLEEPYIRLASYEGVVSTEDYEGLVAHEGALFECSPNKLIIVLDTHRLTKLTANPLIVPGFIKLMRHAKLAYLIMVSNNTASNYWAHLISRLVYFAPVHISRSVEEAYEFASSYTDNAQHAT
jgi:hypothetical protein